MTPFTLVDLVARTVRHQFERTALDFAATTVTYRELWEMSGAIRDRINPTGRVGRYATGSLFSYAVRLGVLRAGATMVPVDRRHTVDRTCLMVRSTAVSHLLIEPGCAPDAAHQQLGSNILLVWDTLTAHVSAAMEQLIASRAWLAMFQLPPYAAEINRWSESGPTAEDPWGKSPPAAWMS